MFWDIALPVLAAAAQALTGFLGWRVTVDGVKQERKKVYEWLFAIASLVGIVSVGIAAYRGSQISTDLAEVKSGQSITSQNIQKLAEKPPSQITLEPFAGPASTHSHFRVLSQGNVPYDPIKPFFVNVDLINGGLKAASSFSHVQAIKLLPRERRSEEMVWNEVEQSAKHLQYGPSSNVFQPVQKITFSIPSDTQFVLSSDDIKEITAGRKMIYLAAVVKYRDEDGPRRLELCESFGEDRITIHYCEIGHNQ